MTTAEEVFTMAIHLMDQQNDATGAAAGREVGVYRTRALSVMNAVLPALRPYSDEGTRGQGGRCAGRSQTFTRRCRWMMGLPGGYCPMPWRPICWPGRTGT